ncbi:FluG domain-containing protein, partial [Colletotrichum lupini]
YPIISILILIIIIKFVYYKGIDNKPKPTIFYFTLAKKLIFYIVSTIIALALYNYVFNAASLTSVFRILRA